MTIAERINLHKCGYTRAEIDALAKEEKESAAKQEDPTPEEKPKENPASSEEKPKENPAPSEEKDPVLEAIKGLTAAIQASNIHKDEQPETKSVSMNDIINQV